MAAWGEGEGKGPRDEVKGQVLQKRRETARRFHPVTQMDGRMGNGVPPLLRFAGAAADRPHVNTRGWRWGV